MIWGLKSFLACVCLFVCGGAYTRLDRPVLTSPPSINHINHVHMCVTPSPPSIRLARVTRFFLWRKWTLIVILLQMYIQVRKTNKK
jgi:hypothetical protein